MTQHSTSQQTATAQRVRVGDRVLLDGHPGPVTSRPWRVMATTDHDVTLGTDGQVRRLGPEDWARITPVEVTAGVRPSCVSRVRTAPS